MLWVEHCHLSSFGFHGTIDGYCLSWRYYVTWALAISWKQSIAIIATTPAFLCPSLLPTLFLLSSLPGAYHITYPSRKCCHQFPILRCGPSVCHSGGRPQQPNLGGGVWGYLRLYFRAWESGGCEESFTSLPGGAPPLFRVRAWWPRTTGWSGV